MCNRRTISETISGPATDALERALKRPRTEKSNKTQTVDNTTFYFPELYNNLVATIDGSDEAFPSIAWNFDDESDSDDRSYTSHDFLQSSTHSFMKCKKDVFNSLQRSKSFRTNLANISERPSALNQRILFESNLEPIRTTADEGTKIFPQISNVFSGSRGFEIDTRTQVYHTKILKQDHGDQFQHSLGFDVL